MPVCPPLYVSAPAVVPYQYGLFSVASFPVVNDPHWACGVEYEPQSCNTSRCYPDQCDQPAAQKTLDDGVPLVTATPFTIYDGYLCRLPGRSMEREIFDRARNALLLGEQRAVEESFWTGSCGNRPRLADPSAVVLNAVNPPTAGDALKMPAAIAALEEYAGRNYSGQAVIHGPRGAIALMAAHHQLVRDATRLTTWAGTYVAGYGGSPNTGPDGTPAPAGTVWLYVTSGVSLWRGPVIITPDTLGGALNRSTNEVEVVAERQYVAGIECILAAVLADASC